MTNSKHQKLASVTFLNAKFLGGGGEQRLTECWYLRDPFPDIQEMPSIPNDFIYPQKALWHIKRPYAAYPRSFSSNPPLPPIIWGVVSTDCSKYSFRVWGVDGDRPNQVCTAQLTLLL